MSRSRTLRTILPAGTLLLASAFGAIATPDAHAQCAMCKEATYDQHDAGLSNRLGHGFNASVYGMLGVPALLLIGLVVLIRKNLRAQVQRDEGQPPGEP